ncbi:MAG TPA: trypsin-like serine protease [Oligoflexus sp.]|uniref:trypsin-like serine protease n=1 Tax=Oligoflexus sp. TaxID=1971216 RepID=UPI002D53DFD0|nr:trypsin-like serine protease [Oligoflexus sp.]HYX34461.1 trypsin-like serine protease [Oligoflexus sp.]
MKVGLKHLKGAVLMVSIGLASSHCSRPGPEDSELLIRNGGQVAENSTGPERVSTVGLSIGCTGTVIASNLILTAAHCVSNKAMSVVFRTNMYQQGTGVVIPVERKVYHAQYKPTGKFIVPYDIAMLKLASNIPATYKPVKLLPAGQPLKPGEAVVQAGYGETIQRGGGAFGRLRAVANTYSGRGSFGRVIVSNQNLKGTCAGDSGGPVFVKRGAEWYVAGALSGGAESQQHGCLGGGTYTGVAEFQDWIIRAGQNLSGKTNPFPAAPAAAAPIAPKVLNFGPFGSNESKLLATLESQDGKFVNFTITIDTETHPQCAFDHVAIQDAAGNTRKICGKGSWVAKNFLTPVKVIFNSDPYENSNTVKVSAINYFDVMAQDEQSSSSDVTEEIPVESPDGFKEES